MTNRTDIFIEQRARVGYEAYSKHASGKSLVSGNPLPLWDDLPSEIQNTWKYATEAIIFQM